MTSSLLFVGNCWYNWIITVQFSIECQKEFGIELVWFSFAPLLIEKMRVILRTNQMKIWYQPRHLLLRFPALRVGSCLTELWLARCYFPFSWLALEMSLVLVFRHSIEIRSIANYSVILKNVLSLYELNWLA